MRRCLRVALGWVVVAGSVLGQQQLAGALDVRIASSERGSVAWSEMSLARLHALGKFDLRRCASEAEALWRELESADALLGMRAAVAVHVAEARSLLDGDAVAEAWLDRAELPAGEVHNKVLADYYLTRARTLCVLQRHDEELELAVRGQACAEMEGDWLRQIQAALSTLHVTPGRGFARTSRLFEEADAAGASWLVDSLRPAASLSHAAHLNSRGNVDSALSEILRAENEAKKQGNLVVLGGVALARAELASNREDREQEVQHLRVALAHYEACHNSHALVRVTDLLAEVAIRDGRLEDARARIAEAESLLDGRGWRDREHSLLIARFNLAIKEHDGELADELSSRIEELGAFFDERAVRYTDVTEQLVTTERKRAEMERELEAEKRRFAERAQAVWMWGGIAGAFGLGVVLAIVLCGRRRLVAANAQLATRLDQLEEARADKAELEDRMRQIERTEGLGTLGAGIAHDFNNLLTSMIGGAELLRFERRDSDREELIEMILAAGKQGARLCRQLQSYSGGAPLQREPMDLLRLVTEMLPVLAAPASGALTVTVAPESHAVVALVDRGEFEQVLLNLAVNAHEAGAKKVSIGISDGELGLDRQDAESTSRAAVVVVRDDGAGMPADVAQRIFDPFFTTKFPGRGLGLAVVFGGVRRHGGRVTVESEPGAGSCFSLYLPLAEKEVSLPALPPQRPLAGLSATLPSATTVVVVDDDDVVRRAMVRIITTLGLPSHDFSSGHDALEFLGTLPDREACLMIVDLSMPDMDGDELIVAARETGRSIRVVMMSGHEEQYVAQRASKAAPDYRLAKPFSIEDVSQAMASVLDSMQSAH